jgi:hypothetical protein
MLGDAIECLSNVNEFILQSIYLLDYVLIHTLILLKMGGWPTWVCDNIISQEHVYTKAMK